MKVSVKRGTFLVVSIFPLPLRASYNTLSRYVGNRLCKTTVCARPGGHCRQMEAQFHVSCLMGYAYSHPIPMGWGSVMGLCSLPCVLHALKIINCSIYFSIIHLVRFLVLFHFQTLLNIPNRCFIVKVEAFLFSISVGYMLVSTAALSFYHQYVISY
jgi:hypothetical protein